MEGKVTVTDKRGGIMFSSNIWAVILLSLFTSKWSINAKNIRIYIDEFEISKPEAFEDDGEEGGE